MEIINLNLIPGKAWPVAHATQFDKGREFRANLFEGSQVYTLAGDETVDAIIKKPDGNQVTEALVNTADTYVIVTTTEQMTAVAGPSLGEIRITKGDTVIGSLKFILECEQSADTGIESHSEINNLEAQVAAIVADQYDAGDVIFDNTPTAGHGVGFAVTSEGVLNAIPDELNDLSDVNISGAAQGEALVWNGAEWVNGTVSTVGSIDDLNDVDTTGKANADSLRYNATAQEWEAKPTTVEMTLAEYTALGGDYSGYENTNIIITDAPNLNATAQDISYDGGADTVWDKVESLGASDIAFDSSTLPYTAGNVQSAIGTLSTFAREDVSTQIANGYANLTDVTAELFRIGNVGILQIRCHCTGTISSGTVTLTTSIKSDANYSFRGALGCIDSKSGFMEYNNKTFLIRCPASTTNYLVGAIVFAIGF